MAYLPGFSNDIFISYSHVDNHHIDARGTLWVDHFHRELQGLVNACVGQPVQIWRDPRISGTSVFSNEIADRLRKTAIIIAIVSPGYINSDWCRREREIFAGAAQQSGGLDIGNARRIIRVAKLPVPIHELPEVLKLALGFELYSVDEHSGKAIDLLFDPRPEAERLYRRTLSHLAQAIADLLRLMHDGPPAEGARNAGITVYLAESTSDLDRERGALRLELEARGCTVLPRQPLPHSIENCTQSVREDLARSKISLHLLGKRYGLIPEGGTQSLIELQIELAAEQAAAGCKTVLWVPRSLDPAEEPQRAFLERVRNQRTGAAGFELLETSFEELKAFTIDLLEPPASAPEAARPPAPAEPEAVPQIYLVRDKRDRETIAQVSRYLFDQGLEVVTPADDGEETELRQNHEENLKNCDGVMIWWGSTKKIWLDYMMRDLDRARGLGRLNPFRAKAVCIAPPPVPDKEAFMTHKAEVIKLAAEFTPDPLTHLLQAMKSAGNG